MKKRLLSLITIIMVAIIGLSVLPACNLVTIDEERDMAQVVATVKVEDAPQDEIYKRDMVMAYMNYGYMYEQYYSYTRADVFKLIIDNLIQTRVYIQNAMKEFNDRVYEIELNTKYDGDWNIDRYLTDEEIIFAEYSAKKDLNEMLKSYEEVEDEEEDEEAFETPRTIPTNAKNKEKEVSEDEQKNYVVDVNSTTERKAAFKRVIRLLQKNSLLGDYNGDILETQYFKDTVLNYKENKILEKYELAVRASILDSVGFSELESLYSTKYNTQKDWTDAEFASALSSAKADSPILVNSTNGTFGYVYNLLLGASSEQQEQIKAISKNISIEKREEQRALILQGTKVKDLRSSWVLSAYDHDFIDSDSDNIGTIKFKNDFAFLDDSLDFKGEVELVSPATDDKVAKYKILSTEEYTLDSFINLMENYVYGGVQSPIQNDKVSIYRGVNTSNAKDNYDERINELLFAFSTDDGSLNTYKGYAIKPIPDGSASEEWVQEFADAGRKLLGMGKNSYIMVASDYGYHVMFYSEVYNADYDYENLAKYLSTMTLPVPAERATWEAEFEYIKDNYEDYEDKNSFIYLLTGSVITTKVNAQISTKQEEVLSKYVYDKDTSGVVKYESRYADLLG